MVELVAQLDLDRRQHLPGGRDPASDLGVVGLDRRSMVVWAEHGDRRCRLGQAIGVDEARRGELVERLEQHPLGDLGPSVRERPQGGHVGRALADGVDDPGEHRRDHHGIGDALLAHGRQPHRGVEVLEVHEPPTGERVRQHVRHACHVVRRHRHQHRLVLTGAAELDRAQQVGHQVPMPEQRRLRFRRRAAGVQDDRDAIVVWLRPGSPASFPLPMIPMIVYRAKVTPSCMMAASMWRRMYLVPRLPTTSQAI